jgi:hypothetical protein
VAYGPFARRVMLASLSLATVAVPAQPIALPARGFTRAIAFSPDGCRRLAAGGSGSVTLLARDFVR